MPFSVADAAKRSGRDVLLFAIEGAADRQRVDGYPHHWLALGQTRRFLNLARAAGCKDLVFIGAMVRPSLWQVRLDWQSLLLLPRVIAAYRGGDNHLLSSLAKIAEQLGFRLRAAHEVAPDILVAQGVLTRKRPAERDLADIALALKVLRAAGPFDIGQAVVVAGLHVVALEGIEGTDGMLAHLAELRRRGRWQSPAGTGVLVKAAKPGQDRRLDMPTIGPNTVAAAQAAGLAGIAVIAGGTIAADPQRMIAAADSAKMFIVGAGKARR